MTLVSDIVDIGSSVAVVGGFGACLISDYFSDSAIVLGLGGLATLAGFLGHGAAGNSSRDREWTEEDYKMDTYLRHH